MQQQQQDGGNPILGHNTDFGADVYNYNQQGHHQQHHTSSTEEESASDSSHSNQLRRSIGRINLDLSGRVMCHVFSPKSCTQGGEVGRDSIPLFSLKSQKTSHINSEEDIEQPRVRILQRIIPHIYMGANYDLDEVWYGATRWIARCSWGSSTPSVFSESSTTSETIHAPAWQSAVRHTHRKIFPLTSSSSPSSSSWIVDVEGEQSVFDSSDSTARARFIQSDSSTQSNTNNGVQGTQQISLEYDSAKYFDTSPYEDKRILHYSPTISVGLKTPFLHPRLEVRSRSTWVVKEGGDSEGNYYGGNYHGSESSTDRRLESIMQRFREGIPISNQCPDESNVSGDSHKSIRNRVSRRLENDGWMPRKVTTDLMGNLVSVSEVGLGGVLPRSRSGRKPPGVCAIGNAGLRLRISKRIDWTTMGVFPWSNNNANSQRDQESTGWLDALQSTHVRFEICGLYDSGERCASVGVDVDPLDWNRTFKFIVGQESVSVLGER